MNLVNEGVLPPDELDDRDERREEQEIARSRETVADIVALVRRVAQHYEDKAAKSEGLLRESFGLSADNYRIIADRLEAAWKRDEERAVEHATRHAEAVARDNCRDCVHNPSGKNYEGGNAAAIHEALRKIDRIVFDKRRHTKEEVEAHRLATEALTVPPRNCDRFADARTACQAWYDDAENWDDLGFPKLELHEWLFAHAAERKGDGDAR